MKRIVREKIETAPSYPGVYIFKGKAKRFLYIGKATDLKTRLKSYLQLGNPKHERIKRYACDLEFIATNSETEALTLEESLIKLNKPRYNVRLKDDKKYPYLKLTVQDRFPRLYVTRNLKKDGSLIFGPYTSAKSLRRTVKTVTEIFKLRSCRKKFPLKKGERACLNFAMDRCLAPCQENISEVEYRTIVDEVIHFLNGKSNELEKGIEMMMFNASKDEKYELAARFRDQLRALRMIKRRQKIVSSDGIDRDVIGISVSTRLAVAVIFKIRDNALIGKEIYKMEKTEGTSVAEVSASILRLIYTHLSYLPTEIILKEKPEDMPIFEEWLRSNRGHRIYIRINPAGERRRLLEWTIKNAELTLAEELGKKPVPKVLIELDRHLHLGKIPHWIEAFDVSNIRGKEATGSSIAFINARPKKSFYRHYRIRTVEGIDDYAMIREIVGRRVRDLGHEIPDLFLIDGGKGQLSAALRVLAEEEIDIPVLAFAKRFDQLFLADGQIISIPLSSPALRLLKRIRDEAHRFAISYHKKLRRRKIRKGRLETLPGIGPKRALILIRHFKDLERIKGASEDELTNIPGIGKELARSIYEALHM